MDLRCTTNKYDELYARYVFMGSKRLLDLAKVKRRDSVLDLCGGSGALSEAANARSAVATLFDLNPRGKCHETRWMSVKGDAHKLDDHFEKDSFDAVICRQAINYLNPRIVAAQAARVLKPEGRFVFNTFAEPKNRFLTYRFDDKRYFELAWHFGKTCWHLQASPTVGVDVSRFTWYSIEELFKACFESFHNVEIQTKGASVYVCAWMPRGKDSSPS
jgi:ubiquinone/menaquinone biosynthesis C-methylase UbiE